MQSSPLRRDELTIETIHHHGTATPDRLTVSVNQSFRGSASSSSPQRRWLGQSHTDAEQEYKDLLRQLEEDDNVTPEQIQDFKKVAIIKRSIEEVRRRAQELQDIRRSPTRYNKVQSKVGQHLHGKTQYASLTASNLKNVQNVNISGYGTQTITANNYSKNQFSQKSPEKRKKPFDITQDEMERMKNLELNQKAVSRLNRRDEEIREAEIQLENLKLQLQDRRKFHERVRSPEKAQRTTLPTNAIQAPTLQSQSVVHPPTQDIQPPEPQQITTIRRQNGKNKTESALPTSQKKPFNDYLTTISQREPLSKDEEKANLFLFNVHKALRQLKYSLNTWKELQTRIRQNCTEAMCEEVAYVQEQCKKINEKDFNELKKNFSFVRDKHNTLVVDVLEKCYPQLVPTAPQTIQIKKSSPQKSEMRPGGIHGSKLQQNSETIQVNKNAPIKTEMRPGGRHGATLDIKDSVTIGNMCVNLNGELTGDILIVETRKNKIVRTTVTGSTTETCIQVKKSVVVKQMAANPMLNGAPKVESNKNEELHAQLKNQLVQQTISEKSSIINQSEELSQGIESESENFGGMVKKEAKEFEKRQSLKGQFVNSDLLSKTEELQNEFDKVMQQLNDHRGQTDGDVFYQAINEYYYGDDTQRHQSPNKRLIQHKNTTVEHKNTMKTNIEKGDYSLVYTTGTKKSYIVEPHGGELNYKLAEKNPLKFYDQVFSQDITKHKVQQDKETTSKQLTVTSKVTKRPHLKIMEKIKEKIAQKLREKLGEQFGDNILSALKDKQIDLQIKQLVKDDKLQIVDQQNKPVYKDQIKEELGMTVAQNKKRKFSQIVTTVDMPSETKLQILSPTNSSVQPDMMGETKTHLKIAERDLEKLEDNIKKVIRRTSVMY